MTWTLPAGALPHVISDDVLLPMLDKARELSDAHDELVGNALKTCLMLGWATDELTLCRWPSRFGQHRKTTVRALTPREFRLDPNGDVFEVVIHGIIQLHDEYEWRITGRWLDWPMRY